MALGPGGRQALDVRRAQNELGADQRRRERDERLESRSLEAVALPSCGEPAAPARTSREARPVFITTERVNPDVAVSVSICAT